MSWCEAHGFKVELLSESPSEAGGFKEIVFSVHGVEAYKNLKFEAGVHRVRRIAGLNRRGGFTPTVTVAVLPEAEEADIEIRDPRPTHRRVPQRRRRPVS